MIGLDLIPWIIWGAMAAVFTLLSLVLIYHWRRFGKGFFLTLGFEIVYLVVGISLLSLAFGVLVEL